MIDVLTLPYWNRGIYKLADLPLGHQDEITSMIAGAQRERCRRPS